MMSTVEARRSKDEARLTERVDQDVKEDTTKFFRHEPSESLFSARHWNKRNVQDNGKLKVTMMQWNMLANGLSGLYGVRKDKTFVGIANEHLEQSYRVALMLNEISKWDCDILCFEEFDFWHNADLLDGLRHLGYVQGAGRQKTWSPIVLQIDPTLPADGVTIFYKEAKFDCLGFHTTDERYVRTMKKQLAAHASETENREKIPESELRTWFSASAVDRVIQSLKDDIKEDDNDDEEDDDPVVERHFRIDALKQWSELPSPPISCGTLLVPKSDPSVKLYVMTTHLNSRKGGNGESIRLKQLQDLLFDEGHAQIANSEGVHAFLSCDMNGSYQSVSGNAAGVPLAYPFLVGSLPDNSSAEPDNKNCNPDHPFKSATRTYDHGCDVEFPWTSVKDRIEEDGQLKHYEYAIDFVFYPRFGWNVTRVSSIPSKEEIEEWCTRSGQAFHFPCESYPSDHLAICAEFQVQ